MPRTRSNAGSPLASPSQLAKITKTTKVRAVVNHSMSSVSDSDAESLAELRDQSNGRESDFIRNQEEAETHNGEHDSQEDQHEVDGQTSAHNGGNTQDIYECLPQEAKDQIVRYREVALKAKDALKRYKSKVAALKTQNGNGQRLPNTNGNSNYQKTTHEPITTAKRRPNTSTQDPLPQKKTRSELPITDANHHLVEILRSLTEDARPVATKQNPPKYGGNPEEALSWLQAYKLVCKANGWKEVTMARNLITSMTGTAQKMAYRQVSRRNRRFWSIRARVHH